MPEDVRLTYQTKCRMPKGDGTPCGYVVTDSPLNVAIVGQPDARVQRFIEALMKHVAKKHPQAFALAQMRGNFFFGYLITGIFESPDPAIAQMRKHFEEQLRRDIIPHAVTDDEIEGALGAIGLTMQNPDREKIKGALQHLRDYYEGKIPQQTLDSARSLVVTP